MKATPPEDDSEQNDACTDQAFLFDEIGTGRRAITRAPMELPPSAAGWTLVQSFTLGIQHVMPVDKDPEPVLRAIFADGFYIWDGNRVPETHGTGQ